MPYLKLFRPDVWPKIQVKIQNLEFFRILEGNTVHIPILHNVPSGTWSSPVIKHTDIFAKKHMYFKLSKI